MDPRRSYYLDQAEQHGSRAGYHLETERDAATAQVYATLAVFYATMASHARNQDE